MHGIVKVLLMYFAHSMKPIDFKWERLTDEEKLIFIDKHTFEVIVREYEIFKQTS
jgi:hypothetical protein